MNPIFAAALEIQGFCHSSGYRSCIIGGLALQRWGEPRLTMGVDLTLLTGDGGEAPYVDALLGRFTGRLPDARDFALKHRVVLLASEGGIPIDVALGAMPFEERAVERASEFEIGEGERLLTCSAEDLIVFKAFAGRGRDWIDVEGIVARQAGSLDEKLVWRELGPLLKLKQDSDSAARLRKILVASRS